MEPLSQVWKSIEDVKNNSSGKATLFLEEVATNLDKHAMLRWQVYQSAAHHRGYNALSSTMKDQKKLKETLQEKSELLSAEHRMLFRGKFQNFVTDNVKSKQNSEETFRSINRGKNHQLFS